MTTDMMVVVDLDGKKDSRRARRVVELLMHLEVYKNRPTRARWCTRIRRRPPDSPSPAFRSIARCSPR
jgi:hypothetical protein